MPADKRKEAFHRVVDPLGDLLAELCAVDEKINVLDVELLNYRNRRKELRDKIHEVRVNAIDFIDRCMGDPE